MQNIVTAPDYILEAIARLKPLQYQLAYFPC